MDVNDGGPAFPLGANEYSGTGPEWGMSLRDYMAGKVLQGLLAGTTSYTDCGYTPQSGLTNMENDTRLAYQYADAMLKARQGASNG